MTMRNAAGGAGQVDEPPREGDDHTDDGPDGGAAAAIKGTSLAGPTAGTVGAMADGSLGGRVGVDPESNADDREEAGEASERS
jgi:hypothetical protein